MKYVVSACWLMAVGCNSSSATTDAKPSRFDGAVATGDAALDAAPPLTVMKSDGVTPANFACNHHFTDGAAEAAVTENVDLTVYSVISGARPGRMVTMTLVDPTTALPMGTSTVTDTSGHASLSVPGNSRVAWMNSSAGQCGDDNCVDTYEFNRLTLSSAQASSGVLTASIYEIDKYVGIASGDGSGPPGASNYGSVLGTVTDCDGDTVQNAHIRANQVATNVMLCDGDGSSLPCSRYQVDNVGASNRETNSNGEFLLLGLPTGAVTITATGLLAGASAESDLGSVDAVATPGAFALATLTPLRN